MVDPLVTPEYIDAPVPAIMGGHSEVARRLTGCNGLEMLLGSRHLSGLAP